MKTYNYLETLFKVCITKNITDIHIDCDKEFLVLRQNKRFIMDYETDDINKLFNYLKYESRMHMESNLISQTGSFKFYIESKVLYLRFAALETLNRKHGVVRILNSKVLDTLESCGMPSESILIMDKILKQQNGLILFAGKTGAGKSTTMYASINRMNSQAIFSLESPIERIVSHIIQIEYHKNKLNDHITQLLRHDPDVLVIGEVRQPNELNQVIRAALSGHLVMTTIHAGSMEEVIHRIQDLSIHNFDIRRVLKGIIYQHVEQDREGVKFKFEIYTYEDIKKMEVL